MDISRATPHVTSYDILKTLAVLLMFIDHIGAFIFVDEDIYRIIGRLCVPMWFFLIGYARSRSLDRSLLGCAAAIFIIDVFVEPSVFPLNILISIICIRLILDRCAHSIFKNTALFYSSLVLFFILALHSALVFDYGTQGLLFALLGYSLRHKNALSKQHVDRLTIASVTVFFVAQSLSFQLDLTQALPFFAGLILVMFYLLSFTPKAYVSEPWANITITKNLLGFFGRYTLWIYTAHIIILKIYYANFIQ